eukprot:GHVS01022974.1.p1 GENE.GHVS01022974.1~~GHVS01022974.1.p1  ORF type:complete len:823 (+),score=94.89 GHVS01022974.1:143-2611(+)
MSEVSHSVGGAITSGNVFDGTVTSFCYGPGPVDGTALAAARGTGDAVIAECAGGPDGDSLSFGSGVGKINGACHMSGQGAMTYHQQANGSETLPTCSVLDPRFGGPVLHSDGRPFPASVLGVDSGTESIPVVALSGICVEDFTTGSGNSTIITCGNTTSTTPSSGVGVTVGASEPTQTSAVSRRVDRISSDGPKRIAGAVSVVANPQRKLLLECDSLSKLLTRLFSEIRQDIIDRLVAQLEAGDLPAVAAWTLQQAAAARAPAPVSGRPGPICEPIAHDVMVVLTETIRDVLQDVRTSLEKCVNPSAGTVPAGTAAISASGALSAGGSSKLGDAASVAGSSSTAQNRKRGRPRIQAVHVEQPAYDERANECVWGATSGHEEIVADESDGAVVVEKRRGGGRGKWSNSRRGIRCIMPVGPIAVLSDGPPMVMIAKDYDRLPLSLQEKYTHTAKQSEVVQSVITSLRRYDRTMEVWVDEEGRCINPVPTKVFGVSSRAGAKDQEQYQSSSDSASNRRSSAGSTKESRKLVGKTEGSNAGKDDYANAIDEDGEEEGEDCDNGVAGSTVPYEAYRYVSCVLAVRRKQAGRAYRFEPSKADDQDAVENINESTGKKAKKGPGHGGSETPSYWYEYKVKWCISKQEDTWELNDNLSGMTERLNQLKSVYNRQRIRLARLISALDKLAKSNKDKPFSPDTASSSSSSAARRRGSGVHQEDSLDDSPDIRCSVVISPMSSPVKRRSRGGGHSAKCSAPSTDDGTEERTTMSGRGRGRGRPRGGRGGGVEKWGRRRKQENEDQDEEEEEVGNAGSHLDPTFISASDFLPQE